MSGCLIALVVVGPGDCMDESYKSVVSEKVEAYIIRTLNCSVNIEGFGGSCGCTMCTALAASLCPRLRFGFFMAVIGPEMLGVSS